MGGLKATPDEKQILQVKYSAKPFGKLSNEALLFDTDRALLTISIITGWEMPSPNPYNPKDPVHLHISANSILADQMSKMLIEKYPTINVNEVEYAFRNYPAKEWGKQMNLSIISEVMGKYLSDRSSASEVEATHVAEPSPLPAASMTDEEKIEFGKWAALNMHQVETVYNCYEVLRRLELMPKPTPEEMEHYKKLRGERYTQLTSESEGDPNYFKFLDFNKWSTSYLQKLAVVNYFKSIQ